MTRRTSCIRARNMANIERRELGYFEDKARAYESYIAAVAEVRSKRHPLESAK